MSSLAIFTRFKAKDETSAKFRKMSKQAEKFGRTSRKSFKMASAGALNFKSVLTGVLGANLISRGMSELTRGARAAASAFIEMDDALGSAAAKLDVKRGTKAFNDLEKAARDVGATTQFTAQQAAQGLDELATKGFNASDSMRLLGNMVDLATATGIEMAEATAIGTGTLNAFGLRTKDAAKNQRELIRVSDIMAKTHATSGAVIGDLAEAMRVVAPTASSAGAGIAEISAILGKLGDKMILGSEAGTKVRNMFLNLQATTPRARKALKKMGIQVADNAGDMRPMIDILGDYEKATAKMGGVQKAATTELLFGKRAISAVQALMEVGSDSIREYAAELEGAGGSTQKMASEMRESAGNQIKILQSGLTELGIKFIKAFEKDGRGSLKELIRVVQSFDVAPLVQGAKRVVDTFIVFAKWVKENRSLIKGLVVALAGAKGLTMAIGLVKGGFIAMQAVMAVSPFGVLLVATAAIVGGIAALNDQLDQVIEKQHSLQRQEFLTEAVQDEARIREAMNDTQLDNFSKQLSLNSKLQVQLKKQIRQKEHMGKLTETDIARLKVAQAEAKVFQALRLGESQRIFEGGPSAFAEPNFATAPAATVDINLGNAPAGTTATAKSKNMAPPKIKMAQAGAVS